MAFNLKNRHLLSLVNHTEREIKFLLDLSRDLKRAKYAGTEQQRLKGKNIALIFEKLQPVPVVLLKWRPTIKAHT
ncbi:ornithine carbamoyltransferase [Actinobacillus pleuropneumoniae]|nr:ornithine carbamoyltransferase [Actinobacillus pleuropneumoniae]